MGGGIGSRWLVLRMHRSTLIFNVGIVLFQNQRLVVLSYVFNVVHFSHVFFLEISTYESSTIMNTVNVPSEV